MAGNEAPNAHGEPFGGEVRLGPPQPTPWLRWFNYVVYVVTIIYLLVNRSADGPALVLGTAAVLAMWLAFFWLRRAPPEP